MPYTNDNPPTWVKNLPTGAQHLCVKAFNAVVREGGSDDEARVACWKNIKTKYKQQGDKWVRKEDKDVDMEEQVFTETHFTDIALSEEDKNDRGYHTAKLLVTRGDYVNQNNRVYPMSIWEREVPRVQGMVTTGSFVGQADHPGFLQGPSILDTVIKFESLSIEGNEVWGDVIFIPTSKGKDVIEIAKAGVRIGVSTRGNGSGKVVEEYTDSEGVVHKDVMLVQDNYKLEAADIVVRGSVEGAEVYHFEHLGEADMNQLQEILFSHIEERVSEPLNEEIANLKGQVEEKDNELATLQEGFDELTDKCATLEENLDSLKGENNELLEQNEALTDKTDQLEAEVQEISESFNLETEANAELTQTVEAIRHLLERVKDEQFAMLLIEELKDCTCPEQVDAQWDEALKTVEALVQNAPTPSARAVTGGEEDDTDSDEDIDTEYHRILEVMGGFDAPRFRR